MKFLLLLLIFAVQDPLPPSRVILPLTLSPADRVLLNEKVNNILQRDAELKATAADLLQQERTGEVNLAILQVKFDKDEAKIVSLTAEVVIQCRWKWRWFWIATGEGLILLALAYLKLKP